MTCPEPKRDDERAAKRLVRSCLGDVEVCLHDDGSQSSMHDLDLRWSDGHVEAMEVTRATSETLRQLTTRLNRQGPVPGREVTRNWYVALDAEQTDVAFVRSRIDHLLSRVEKEGITKFGRPEARRSQAIADVRELGVDVGVGSRAAREAPKITLHPPMRWWFHQPGVVNRVVEDHALLNAEKLARSGRDERHLFVLFDLGEVEALSVIRDGEPPGAPPQLPEAVTTAWVASNRADGSPIVWRVRQTGLWEVLL